MYRCNLDSDKDPSGIGHHKSTFQECPWLWLSKLRIKKWIKNDPLAFHAYIEDISDKYWDEKSCSGKIVWQWINENPKYRIDY